MTEGVSLPELVECEPYRARITRACCVTRYQRATRPGGWGEGPYVDTEYCLDCEVGRRRAAGGQEPKTMPKSCRIEGCDRKTVRLESGHQSGLCQRHLDDREQRRARARRASAEKKQAEPAAVAVATPPAPKEVQVKQQQPEQTTPPSPPPPPPTCRFFQCANPCRTNPATHHKTYTAYCSEHGLAPNPGLRSRQAEAAWRLAQLEPSAVDPQAAEEQPTAPQPSAADVTQQAEIRRLDNDRTRLPRVVAELQERLAQTLDQRDEANAEVERLRQQAAQQVEMAHERAPEEVPAGELFRLARYAIDRARELLGGGA